MYLKKEKSTTLPVSARWKGRLIVLIDLTKILQKGELRRID